MRASCRAMVWLGVWSATVLLPAVSVRCAEVSDHGFYFRGGIGPVLAHQTDVNEFFGPVSGVKVKYDPGLRVNVAGGYQFCGYFSAELESGLIHNSIKSITGSPDTDASLANVPLLVNAVFQFPLESRFVPYFGFGVGGSTSVLDVDHATLPGKPTLHGTDSDAVWAVQGFTGFRYEFADNMGVGFGYKFLATGEPKWDVLSVGPSGKIGFENARTHAFMAEFTLKF